MMYTQYSPGYSVYIYLYVADKMIFTPIAKVSMLVQ